MLFSWIALAAECLIYFVARQYFYCPAELAALIIIAVNAVIIAAELFSKVKDNRALILLLSIVLLRLSALLFSHLFKNTGVFSGFEPDSLAFDAQALSFALTADMDIDPYSRLVGMLYLIYGRNVLLAKYVNFLASITKCYMLFALLKDVGVDIAVFALVACLFSYFQHYYAISLTREPLISLFALASAGHFYEWIRRDKTASYFAAFAFSFAASYLHAGMAALPIVYIFIAFTRFDDGNGFFVRVALMMMAATALLLLTRHSNYFLSKFQDKTFDDVVAKINISSGYSVYLEELNVNTPLGVIAAAPIKLLYFWFSPLPHRWRGAADIAAFLFDGAAFLVIFYVIARRFRRFKPSEAASFLALAVIVLSVVFALGTSNAGTAIRHRHKFFDIMLLLLAESRYGSTKKSIREKSHENRVSDLDAFQLRRR